MLVSKMSVFRLFISIACILYGLASYGKMSDIQLSQLPTLPKEDVLRKHRSKMHRNLNCTVESHIPCLFWMTTKNVSELQPTYWWIVEFFQTNLDWHIHISDDSDMDKFMEKVFRGTKVLWAFNMINRKLGPARADIWRYSVLWVYGGGYMDTDSYIRTPLNKVKQCPVKSIFYV
jgi:mannosyltransferase OCH1-like enzyme